MQFSQEIRERTKEYFKRRFGVALTDAEANLALTRLVSFAEILTDAVTKDSDSADLSLDGQADSSPGCRAKGIRGPMAGPRGEALAAVSGQRDRGAGCVAPSGGHAELKPGGTDFVTRTPQTPTVDDGQ